MLIIRKEHMTLRISQEEGFVDWYVNDFMPEHLAEFHESFSNEDLYRMVRNGRKEAIAYGFDDPSSQVHFVTLMWKIGANFHHFPGFKEIASTTEQSGQKRIERFYNEVTDDQGAEAVLGANDRYWFPETLNRGVGL
jgi:hypothetical protein